MTRLNRFAYDELHGALAFVLAGPVESGNTEAAAGAAIGAVAQALEDRALELLRDNAPYDAMAVLRLADGLLVPEATP